MASLDRYHLLVVDLHTGRHHQIRAQLAKIGLHIKGDLKNGAAHSNPNAGIHLHARKLEFMHPVKKEPVRIVAAPPKGDPIWDTLIQLKQIKG
jgi:23S rRNA pseudouridine1911/1915/1917 synthase